MSITVNSANNRVNGWTFDTNGNGTGKPGFSASYDVENRLQWGSGPGGEEYYGYAADNRRVYQTKLTNAGSGATQELVTFWSGGRRAGRFELIWTGAAFAFRTVEKNVWFGGKPLKLGTQTNVVTDRLGSVRREPKDFFPYGQERTPTPGETEKYATYMHDGRTGLAYADQRYYATGAGRFMTAEPYRASAGAGDPGSWNRYTYVEDDPLNFSDSRGLQREDVPDPCQGDPNHPGCHGEPPTPGKVISSAPPLQIQLAKELSKRRENGEFTECEGLARFAEGVAKGAGSAAGTVSSFGALIKANASPAYQILEFLGLMHTSSDATYIGALDNFGADSVDNGYKPQFKEDAVSTTTLNGTVRWSGGNNADQSHHFALFIQVGFYATAPLLAQYINEGNDGILNFSSDTNKGDLNLGYAAISIGRRLRSGAIKPGDLGNTIRAEICNQ